MKISRKTAPLIDVCPLSAGADDLQSAADMAREWGETPFDEARARAHFAARKKGQTALLALRDGEPAGLLFAEPCGLWTDPRLFAFAPMVWTRGVCANGAQVPSSARESAALALTRAFLERAKEDGISSARLVFRTGMIPNPPALAAMGLSPHSRIFIRRASLPGDPVSGRIRWFSTEGRSARGQEMNLPVEKMFPELFADLREAPPEARRLESADFERALEIVCASRRARGLPFSENGFRRLFRDAIARRDCCALATTDEKAEDGRLSGVVIGATTAHPFADGRVSRAELMEWRTDGAKAARRALWGLWRGFMFWSARGLCRAMLVAPPEGKFGDEFVRKNRLTPFGACWAAELGRSGEDGNEEG